MADSDLLPVAFALLGRTEELSTWCSKQPTSRDFMPLLQANEARVMRL